MSDSAKAGWDVVLPQIMPSVGQIMQQEHLRKQQDRKWEWEQQRYERQDKRDQDAEDFKKLKFIQDEIDPTKHLTGVQRIDAVSSKALEDVYKDVVAKSGDMSMADLMNEIKTRTTPIFTGDALAKNKYETETAKLKAYAAQNKNFNVGAATEDVLNRIADMYVAPNDKGGYDFKPADKINHEEDIASSILTPENRWKYAHDPKYLTTALQNIKGEERSYFYKDPRTQEITTYKGNIPLWADESEKPNKQGFVKSIPSFKVKTEKIQSRDSKGNPVNIEYIPPAVRDNILDSDEKVDAFNLMWNKAKQEKGIGNLSPQDEEIMSGAFLKTLIEGNDKNQPRPTNIQQPQKWQIYGAGGGSRGGGSGEGKKKNDTSDFVQRFKAAADSGSQEAMTDVLRELRAGNGSVSIDDGQIKINNKDRGVRIHYRPLIDGVPSKKEQFQDFKLDDPNIYYKLAAFYQKATGSDSKLEKNIFTGTSRTTGRKC
jgi:hypothetical protein